MAKFKQNLHSLTHTIAFRLTLVPSIGLLFALGTGIVSALILHTILGDENADASMTHAVGEYSKNLDKSSIRIEQSVDSSVSLFENYITSTNDLSNEYVINDISSALKYVFEATTVDNDYCCCYWLVINPEYVGQTAADPHGVGFFYTLNKSTNVFERRDPTNVLAYPETDDQHVAWYYKAAKSENPLWMEPFYDAEINRNIVTYASGCRDKSGNLLGCIGMDLDFDVITSKLGNINEFKDPRYFLLNSDHRFLSSPLIKTMDENGRYVGTNETLQSVFGKVLRHYGQMNTHFYVMQDGPFGYQNRALSYNTLECGMVYGISVDATALYEAVNRTTFITMVIFISMTLAVGAIIIADVNRTLRPLRRLTKEVNALKNGKKDIEITVGGPGEIGELSNEVKGMVNAIRSNQIALEALATKDGLTGVKNNNARQDKVAMIDADIRDGKKPKFAIIMADMNDLKHINDNLGHPEGDYAIREMCYSLCHVFLHSPVYRIGGDEFIVIVENEDYNNKEKLFEELKSIAVDKAKTKHPFSVGIAIYHEDVDKNFEDVYGRADNNMYEMKMAYKKKKNQ